MKTLNISDSSLSNNIFKVAVVTAAILLIPLVAMQFSDEVNWTLMDFVFGGGLLFGVGIIYILGSMKMRSRQQKIAFGLLLAVIFFYLWVEMAVGIFTNWGS